MKVKKVVRLFDPARATFITLGRERLRITSFETLESCLSKETAFEEFSDIWGLILFMPWDLGGFIFVAMKDWESSLVVRRKPLPRTETLVRSGPNSLSIHRVSSTMFAWGPAST